MRQKHCTITPTVVRAEANAALKTALPLKGSKKVSPQMMRCLLLLMAATRSSMSACVRRYGFRFSHETARKAVDASLPEDVDTLTSGLVEALHDVTSFSRRDRRRAWDVAFDTHYRPYYGKNPERTEGVVGGQKKHGTKYFYCYATAVLIHRRRRYTVGLLPVTGKLKPHQVVEELLRQIDAHGLLIRGVVLDSGFDSGETILLLQDRDLSYAVPLKRKGQGSNRRNDCFALPVGTVSETEWTTEQSRKRVKTAIYVRLHSKTREVKVYAFGGWGDQQAGRARRRAWLARRKYRQRFGIETSYRQKNQVEANTTKKGVAYRLLLFGLALLLRQVWVLLTFLIARARKAKPTDWIHELPLTRMADWLADLLKQRYKEHKAIPL